MKRLMSSRLLHHLPRRNELLGTADLTVLGPINIGHHTNTFRCIVESCRTHMVL